MWRKSSRSNNGGGGNCVEISLTGVAAAVRDSKNPAGPTISLPNWSAFLIAAKRGDFD
ncbi:MAG: DUF397 domain-containing protein [Umezawaea sp.]